MTTNTPHGAKPGENTPKKIAVGRMSTTTTIKFFAAQIIAIRACLAGAISGIYMSRSIGADTLLMAALLAVYTGWRVFA